MRINWPSDARYAKSSNTTGNTGKDTLFSLFADILVVEIGLPDLRPPWGDDEDSKALILVKNILMEILWDVVENTPEEAAATIGFTNDCFNELTPLELPDLIDPDSYFMPEVSHSPTQNFAITSYQNSQASGSSDVNRRNFWNSRWMTSKDPLGPLDIDVVFDKFLLGCLANKRYLDYAQRFGATESLTQIGVQIMQAHRTFTNTDFSSGPSVPGKLGPRQIADYHHQEFSSIGLPNRTFGGTPISGHRDEALLFTELFCPSCDEDN
ncbi:MAG: hypothetical protein IPM20_02090 [Gammaproteobacteria bacterium]|nr:hypothetical protein [Gammaproteobacteria bacterium]